MTANVPPAVRLRPGAEAVAPDRPPGGSGTRGTHGERGQVVVLTAVMLISLLGMAALVVDVGAWFRAKRQMQAVADAAALAGAQALPGDPGSAQALAVQYADANGGGVGAGDVGLESDWVANDTAVVHASKPSPSFFSSVLGLGPQTIGATAKARSVPPSEARYVAPIGVDRGHPLLSGGDCPCFNQSTTLDLDKVGPGAFRLLNIDGSRGGTSPGTLASWMTDGYGSYMPLGWYYSDPGAKFNSSQMQGALADRIGTDLLFPVYDQTQGQGANFEYRVVGWVGFHLTGFDARGNSGTIAGWFTSITWDGIQGQSPSEDFGAHTVSLVE